MSGVATLKAGAKRGFDEMCIDAPPGPGCSPGRLPLLSPLPKRSRQTPSTAPSSCQTCRPFTSDEIATLANHVPKRLKKVADKVATGQVTATEKLFSVIDVRDIVESVLSERESRLKDEFTKILNDRLAEQFRDFTKFNEDFLSRQYRGKEYSYLS